MKYQNFEIEFDVMHGANNVQIPRKETVRRLYLIFIARTVA
jgi:hypothetical protein